MPLHVRILAAALRLGARLPLRVLHAAGTVLGRLAALLRTREHRVAWRNVELCFPELDATAQALLLRNSLEETGKAMLELARVWGDPRAALADVRSVHG